MRVSLIATAVAAAVLSSGGAAVAAESQVAGKQSMCFVVAKRNTPIVDIASRTQVGTLRKGKSKDSACSPKKGLVFLAGDKTVVLAEDVSINARV
ncbi:hypothetical protein GCM10022247_50250 [Allokutzneria multivorans]|uniref:Uncharacterized protein n=1 Tax=Allokutzneria multivorans TaxID=1142134 RepID=A0ABP7T2Q8_9PSEU